MENSKEYHIPEELCKIIDEARAMEAMRDLYAKLPFGFRKTRKCAVRHENLKNKFWGKVNTMYPELRRKLLTHRTGNQFITELPKEEA